MLSIPQDIKALFHSDSARKKFKLTFYEDNYDSLYPSEMLFPEDSLYPSEHGEPWLIIENDRIVSESLKISEALCSEQDLTFGACESSECQITVADVIEDLTGKEFVLSAEIGSYNMALGIYTVKSFKRQSDRRKRLITAYDRMERFNTDVSVWYESLSFPITVKAMRDSLCQYIGIEQENTELLLDSLSISKTIQTEQISGLDILKAICEINGVFGHISRSGKMQYIQLQQTGLYPSETLYPDDNLFPSELDRPYETITTYKQPARYEDYVVNGIDSLTIRAEKGDIGANVGNGMNPYAIEGNFLVYGKSSQELLNIAQSLLPRIKGRIYRPVSVDCNCMPWLEVGDAIRLITRDDLIESFVMRRTISGCQAMRDRLESTGSQNREEEFSIQKQIIQLEGKTAIISKNVEEVYVEVSNLKEDTNSKLSVMADQITAEVDRATEAEGKLSASIKANAEKIELKVSAGDVSSQISLEKDAVTIRSNRLSWQSDKSSMTANGLLTCENIKATNGTFSGTITGSNITGGTITGTTIEGNTITGGTISGTTITGGTIIGSEIRAKSIEAIGTVAVKVFSAERIDCEGSMDAHTVNVDYLRYGMATQGSDRRLKENIKTISQADSIKLIESLNPVCYHFRDDGNPGIGFIAQEVEEVERSLNLDWKLYEVGKDGFYSIPYLHFIPILTSGIQALEKEVKKLEEHDA
jgi:hypothetical protein